MILILVSIFPLLIYQRNKIAKKQCPKCKHPFGKKAASNVKVWNDPGILDGLPFRSEGYIIHCSNCKNDYLFDYKGKQFTEINAN